MFELPWKHTWKQPFPSILPIGGEKMKTKMIEIVIFVLVICLIPLYSVFPADQVIEGEITGVGKYVGVDGGEGGRAKFTEYRDLREPAVFYLRGRLDLDTPDYFLRFNIQDPGYDTQYYNFDGGMWGKFKFDLFYNEIPHNITFDARTTFLGAGHDTLVGTPNPNPATWDKFDYSYERRQYGGGVKVDIIRPFFFDVSFQRENKEGIKPVGAAETSPGGRAFELPEPVDYVTNNLKVAGGYAKKPLFLSLSYIYSDFNNSNTSLNLPPNFNAPNAFSLPPDNTYHRGAFKGAVSLPFNSRFSTNIAFARGKSETSLFSNFDGEVDTQNYDFALTTNPVRFLDAKVYYKFYKRNNKSDQALNPFSSELANLFLDYKIGTLGGDLGLRLPLNFYLSGGYKYVKTERRKEGETDPVEVLPFNKDNIYSVDLKWSGLDFLETRLGYEKFDRDAQYRTIQSQGDPARRFSYAAQDRDTYKASVDIFPLENLNFGLEYRHREIDYSDTTLGLRKDKRDEFEVSADYIIGKIAKIYGYGDYGWIKFKQRQTDSAGLPWEADQKDRSWGYGIGTEVYAIPNKLKFIFQHDYLKSNGSVDFALNPGLFGTGGLPAFPAANNDNIDITRWDDYTLYSFKIKAVYNFTKFLAASLGYAYERFRYSDAQLNNYIFAPQGPPNSNAAFLTGAYKDQSYKANLIFGGITYKF
jgi:MtrB/PioB family decaheme-associated outer membrane protein